jgi:small subunit ribosomal protein S20
MYEDRPTVASHESALKAHRQNVKRREHNRQLRTRLRTALRDIRAAIDGGNPNDVKDALRQTISLVDKMASKGMIHRNTAGRYKSRLAARVSKKSAAA